MEVKMKIVDVKMTLFTWADLPQVRYAPIVKMGGSVRLGLLAVTTDDGIVGHAFLGSSNRSAERDSQGLIEYLKPVIMGQNPLERERLAGELWNAAHGVGVPAIGAVDVALWDIAGKAANMPIYHLLGSYRDSVPAYASSPAFDSPEEYRDMALKYKSEGWRAYKIHAPHPWRSDIAVCEAVRAAVGDGYPLMLDATWSYDYPTALRVGRAIQDLDFYWYEDPLAKWHIDGYVKLRQNLHIPLMATELPPGGLEQYSPWLLAQATDFLRGDVWLKGGITTCMKAAHVAEAFNMNFEIHHGGNSLNNVANLHVAMAIKNCEYFEVLLPDEVNKYGLVHDIEIDADGLVHAPTGPGVGAEIDFDLIRRNTYAVLS
jgi:L-alanine-DL-glutamate epimerase-like enolase superfamily enzyme